jgi:hypothetical protein
MQFSVNDLTLLLIACEFFIAHDWHGERDPTIARDNNVAMKALADAIRKCVE